MVFKQAKQGVNEVNNNKDIKQSHSRISGCGSHSGIFNARRCEIKGKIPELVSGSSTHAVAVIKRGNPLFNKRQGVEDPETSSGILNFITMNVARGFTLIELLVVVLIIGILAAVALPQYQKAVLKARMSRAIPAVHALKNAEEVYYLANGKYAESGTNGSLGLDIDEIAGCSPFGSSGDLLLCNGFFINVISSGKSGGLDYNVLAGIGDSYNRELGYIAYMDHSSYPGRRDCIAYTENKLANDVCKAMGGTLDYTQSAATSRFKTPYNGYLLP